MARKRRRSRRSSRPILAGSSGLSEGVKQSIFAVGLIGLAVIILLAFFGLAGMLGEELNQLLAIALGWSRWLFGIILFLIGIGLIFPDRALFNVQSVIGVVLFFLSFNGLLNLFLVQEPWTTVEIARAGGFVGMPISSGLASVLGFWGASIIAIAGMFIACFLIFNISLHSILTVHRLFRRGEREEEGGEEETEEEVEDDIEEEIEEEEREVRAPATDSAPARAEESVMTSTRRRKTEIPIDLLDEKSSEAKSGDIDRSQELIRRTFENFNIDVEMTDVRVGPAVTQYALRPAQGIKLSRIVALQNDLALALAAHPIRIEAPIPGKSQVGIEVPNQTVGRVGLRELLTSKEFKHRKSPITAPLGKDVGGGVDMLEIERAPHMLVAGATGSGKSVCLNTIIVSLLYQNGPDDLRLIMVDPKRVELGRYEGIPHLLVPPIVKVEEAINALKWAVREMERRLDHLAKFGARDIESYNKKSKERMPNIVIILDELADLMSQNKRDVEAVIVRIAQMARAAGIHLILATQRPSVDVITGLIKANVPTRVAFAVASQVDSKTILDSAGAEKLLGRGDMLVSTPSHSKPKRLQGAFVSDEEIARIVKFLKKEGTPDYNYQITEDARLGGTSFSPEDTDDMFDEAVQIVIESGKASTSYLQRRLKVGYSRAARMIDMMEEAGVVGPASGSKPREVLIDEWPIGGRAAKKDDYQDDYEDTSDEDDDFEMDDEEAPEDDEVDNEKFDLEDEDADDSEEEEDDEFEK